jgi:hypothetical protein
MKAMFMKHFHGKAFTNEMFSQMIFFLNVFSRVLII